MNQIDGGRTRGRILALLCGGDHTASELAEKIGVTPSAIRMHVSGLAEEGLIAHERVIRGVGKPAHRYRLTAVGEGWLSRAYLPLAKGLLGALADRMAEEELEALLREAGRRVVEHQPAPRGDSRARVRAAAELVEVLGGIVEVEAIPGGAELRGRCCPVAALAPEHPQVCAALEELLTTYTGLAVREHCDRSGRPGCRFLMSFSP